MSDNTVLLYKCDKCDQIITTPERGLVVHGNIYVADPSKRGGLVGNNFMDDKFTPGDPDDFQQKLGDYVKESVYCVPCFLNVCLPNTKIQTMR